MLFQIFRLHRKDIRSTIKNIKKNPYVAGKISNLKKFLKASAQCISISQYVFAI